MSNKYKQPSLSSAVRFQKAPLSELEMSKMHVNPRVYTTYNAGDIIPIHCEEILPHSTFSVDIDFINRLLSPTIRPTMGAMQIDVYAFFVPNRIVNESWKNVQGENTSGYWSAPEVELAPLYDGTASTIQVPPMSVADYYGFATQDPIHTSVLKQCNDLKFRGYLSIYNNYFRDQNYQPPVAFSTLNVYEGFFLNEGSYVGIAGGSSTATISSNSIFSTTDGAYGSNSVKKAIYGDGDIIISGNATIPSRMTSWSALGKPFKANKLHDAFTSILPSPQKGPEVFFGIAESAPLVGSNELHSFSLPIKFAEDANTQLGTGYTLYSGRDGVLQAGALQTGLGSTLTDVEFKKTTAIVDLSQATGVSINDLRRAAAIQQVYEMLGRSGSRYLESLRSFFGIEAENPFKDIPTQLGHFRRELDLYQVAQTSASNEGETAQGTLSGFGYTANEGSLFTYTALEHGYIHYMLVVRNRNIYPTYLAPDNFRMSTLDWYYPQFANIGEQPIRVATLNPFISDAMENSLGFQEAWWEYRFSPDRVSGYCRTGLNDSLDIWTYADSFDPDFDVVTGEWLKSNAQEVLDRTLAVTSAISPQFLIMMEFKTTKQLPMPIYSVPGLDIL